jgi:hypothetical protein
MKLKATQEIMHHRSVGGRIELAMVKFVPVAGHGVEQYIDNGTGYQLRAQIAEKDWPNWLQHDATARKAQEQDDGAAPGAIRQQANSAKLKGASKRKRK